MKSFRMLESRAVNLLVDNIDTDRIIPARFLTTTKREGLGGHLFADWAVGRQAAAGAEILVVGHNFGCGSSREHAVWALLDAGVRVVIATGFADIFHANALRNGLVPVVLESAVHRELTSLVGLAASVVVDLEDRTLSCGSLQSSFEFDPFARHCITRGLDELGFLLEQAPIIADFEARNPPRFDTRGGRQ